MRPLFAIAVSAALCSPVLASPTTPAGVWMTEEGTSKIRVAPCGKSFCATILWVRKSDSVDQNNPNPTLRNRSIIGLELSRDFKADGKGGYAGSIYNPENGKTYQVTMQRRSEGELEVEGCVLGGLLCGSETWSRQSDSTASVAPARRP